MRHSSSPGNPLRSTVIALAAVVLLVTGPNPSMAEDPPQFLLKWGHLGQGPGEFSQPFDIALSNDGYAYVADTGNHRVQRFTSDSMFVNAWPVSENPTGIAVGPDGSVFVVDGGTGDVFKFTSSGALLTSWHAFGAFNIGADPNGGLVYVACLDAITIKNKITKYTTEGDSITSWNIPDVDAVTFWDIAVGPSGNVYATAFDVHRVVKFTSSGSILESWGSLGDAETNLKTPRGVAVDADEDVYVADVAWVRKFTPDGGFLTRWGGVLGGTADGEFSGPAGVALDADGNVYVVDSGNSRIQKFGDVSTPVHPTTWGRIKSLYR